MIIDLKKGKNYRISRVDESGVVVEVITGNFLSSTVIEEQTQAQATENIYSACDEAIPLYDGKTLKRIRDRIFIE
jgi:hypothetical protein